MHTGYTQLQSRLNSLQANLVSNPALAPPPVACQVALVEGFSEPREVSPESFAGECRKFRSLKQLPPSLRPSTLNLWKQVKTIIFLLQGYPQTWTHQLLESEDPVLLSVDSFFTALGIICDDPGQIASVEPPILCGNICVNCMWNQINTRCMEDLVLASFGIVNHLEPAAKLTTCRRISGPRYSLE